MVTGNKKTKQTKKPKKVNNLRYAEYYDMQGTFDELFAKSKNGEVFGNLSELIFSRDNILLAYRNIKGNGGSVTPGTDGLTIRAVEKYTPEALVQKVRNIVRNYSPRAVRRKEIPKQSDPSKTRPLGIPCIWDRLIQQCILQVLEPICEARFSENSYDSDQTEAVNTQSQRLVSICSYPICNMSLSLTSRDSSTMWTIPNSSSKCGRWEYRISV